MTDEQIRLAHLAACQAEAASAIPAPSPQPSVPDHSAEIMGAHEGRPSVASQKARQAGEDISDW